MKRPLLSVLILLMSLSLLGNPVDETTAKQLAQNFWKENNIMGVKGDKIFKKEMDDARFVNVASQCGYSEFYIFNNEDGKGFVIIAADDCVTPILGYSYDNNFATENMPPNLTGWLDGYTEQIRAAVEMRAKATEEIRTDWDCLRQGKNLPMKSENSVSHLLTTTWNQGEYYNMLCPEDNSSQYGGHALTGCAATAMAQILKFWEYPNDAHRVGWHEYEHPNYGMLGANYTYAGGSYYWNYMPNQLTSSSSIYQKQAVASLMYHCGVSVEMNYGPDESVAEPTAAEIAFRAFFDYNNATLVMKSTYTDAQWINLLKNELDNGRPVFYAGYGTGGHAFVCDGYNNSNYFWFNWGWSGTANGYFPLNSLTPNTNGFQHNYSNKQKAIIGIEPGGTNDYHLLGLNDNIKINGDNYMFFPDIPIQEITTEIFNWGNVSFNGSLCAVVFDGEDQYVAESEFINNCQIPPMQSSGQISFTLSESLNILSCKAYVRIYLIENNEPTLVYAYGRHSNPSNFGDYSIIYYEDRATLLLYSNIEYSPATIVQYSEINVTANIINDGIVPFSGEYAAALYSLNGELMQILAVQYEGNELQPGHYTSSLNFSCSSVTVPTGTYYLTIIQKSDGSNSWYPLYSGPTCDNPAHVNPIRVNVVSPASYTITATSNPTNGGTATCNKTILTEEFENYTIGNKITTECLAEGHEYWTTWSDSPGSSEDGYVENFNGSQCGHLTYGNDQVLLLDNINSGVYDLEFDIIVPEGKNGYFSILHHFAGGNSTWAMQCYLHLTNDGQISTSAPGHGTVHAGSNGTADLPCVYNEWMHFRVHVDTDNDIAQLYFNVLGQPENMYAEWQWSLDSFGEIVTDCVIDAIDFFPPNNYATSEFYVDNIVVSNQTNSFGYGDICTLTATPNNGYTFVNWTENGTSVSTNANYSFGVTSNRDLVANFRANAVHFINAGTWSTTTNWQDGALPTANDVVCIDAPCQLNQNATVAALTVSDGQSLTLQSGSTLTVTGDLNNSEVTGLVIEDGAQLFHATENVCATVKKIITGHGANNGKYYLISNPLASTVDPEMASVYHLIRGNYDLYDWLANAPDDLEWRNFKDNTFMMSPEGYGYLYANQNGVELTFPGILKPSNDRFSKAISYDSGDTEHPGWNLIGNPFVCDAYLVNANNEPLPYYRMNAAGNGFELITYGAISPMEGVFYHALGNETVYFMRSNFTPQVSTYSMPKHIVNAYEQTDHNANVEGEQVRIDLSQMAKGIYMMHIEANGGRAVRKIVIE